MISTSATNTFGTELRRCTRCWEVRPIWRFRRGRKGSLERRPQCDWCHRAYEKRQRDAKKGRWFRRFAQDINRARTDAEIVGIVSAAMVAGRGGLPQFLLDWNEHLAIAMQKRPCSCDVLNTYRAVMRLIVAAEELKARESPKTPECFDELSDDELKKELEAETRAAVERRLASMPAEKLLKELRRRGYVITIAEAT